LAVVVLLAGIELTKALNRAHVYWAAGAITLGFGRLAFSAIRHRNAQREEARFKAGRGDPDRGRP
jgi:hypothetical protein